MQPKSPEFRYRSAVAFIMVIAFLDTMAMGLVVPVLPQLIEEQSGSTASAGMWNGAIVASWAAMQFITSPIVGSLSDHFGRRSIILFATAGLAVHWALIACAPNLWWLAIIRIIGGAASANIAAVNAYVADIASEKGRTKAFGLVGAAVAAGWICGPALGGVLGAFGPRVPLWTSAALCGIAFGYGLLILPESLPHDRRTRFSWRRANPVGAIRLLGTRRDLTSLATINFLLYSANHVFSTIFVLYAGYRFNLSILEIGLLMAAAGALDMLVQGLCVGPVVRVLGDRWAMMLGLCAGTAGLLSLATATTATFFALSLILIALWGFAMPSIQALMTTIVSPSQQGQLQGANSSVSSIAGIIAPLIFGWCYSHSEGTSPALSFYLAAAMLSVGVSIGGALVLRSRSGPGAADQAIS